MTVMGVRVDFTGGDLKHRLRAAKRDVDGTEMGQGVRADVTPGRGGEERLAHAARPAIPAGGHARAAVRETGPAGITAWSADRLSRDVREADVERVAAGHASGRPGARDRGQVTRADREQPVAVGRHRGDQRIGAGPRPRAVRLDAIQAPAVIRWPGRQPGSRGLRGPDSPAASGRRRGGPELGEDGERVGVSLGEPGHGKIFLGQSRQRRPAGQGLAVAGQRQVQPARLDRLGEGRRGRGAWPVAGVVTRWRTHDGQRLSSSGHFHPLNDPSLLPGVWRGKHRIPWARPGAGTASRSV